MDLMQLIRDILTYARFFEMLEVASSFWCQKQQSTMRIDNTLV